MILGYLSINKTRSGKTHLEENIQIIIQIIVRIITQGIFLKNNLFNIKKQSHHKNTKNEIISVFKIFLIISHIL